MGTEMLASFLQAIVQKHRRDRYAGHFGSEKGRRKLLAALDHDLERDIEPKKSPNRFPKKNGGTLRYCYRALAYLVKSIRLFGAHTMKRRGKAAG